MQGLPLAWADFRSPRSGLSGEFFREEEEREFVVSRPGPDSSVAMPSTLTTHTPLIKGVEVHPLN